MFCVTFTLINASSQTLISHIFSITTHNFDFRFAFNFLVFNSSSLIPFFFHLKMEKNVLVYRSKWWMNFFRFKSIIALYKCSPTSLCISILCFEDFLFFSFVQLWLFASIFFTILCIGHHRFLFYLLCAFISILVPIFVASSFLQKQEKVQNCYWECKETIGETEKTDKINWRE